MDVNGLKKKSTYSSLATPFNQWCSCFPVNKCKIHWNLARLTTVISRILNNIAIISFKPVTLTPAVSCEGDLPFHALCTDSEEEVTGVQSD